MKLDRVAGVGLVLTLAVLVVLTYCPRPAPPIPPPVQHTVDSLTATAPAFDSTVAVTLAREESLRAEARRMARAALRLTQAARTAQSRGDSLAAVARAAQGLADSAGAWRAAYDERTVEAAGLRQAVDTLTAESVALRFAADSARMVARVALERLAVTAGVVTDLRAAIAKLTTRKPWDYVAVACGAGVRGPDCVLGVRFPLGR